MPTKAQKWAYRASSSIPLTTSGRKFVCMTTAFLLFIWAMFVYGPDPVQVADHYNIPIPEMKGRRHPASYPYNNSKVALMIEDRPLPHLAPLVLHMISVVPPDWRFLFVGSKRSIAHLNRSLPVQMYQQNGKLDLNEIPATWSVHSQEELSVTMTQPEFWEGLGGRAHWDWRNPWLDEQKTKPQVEWILVFQPDSILCANSKRSLNDWLEYDWVGAPWYYESRFLWSLGMLLIVSRTIEDRFGGNGGLSLRRVSKILQVLSFQERLPETELEDLWFTQRIWDLPGAKMANGTVESYFSVEQVWNDEPMGYHTGWSGNMLPADVWEDPKHRQRIWEYCPEIKMILDMELAGLYSRLSQACEGKMVKRTVEEHARLMAW